jgi:hypothetical protein
MKKFILFKYIVEFFHKGIISEATARKICNQIFMKVSVSNYDEAGWVDREQAKRSTGSKKEPWRQRPYNFMIETLSRKYI